MKIKIERWKLKIKFELKNIKKQNENVNKFQPKKKIKENLN